MRTFSAFFVALSLCLLSMTITMHPAAEATTEQLCFEGLIPATQAGSVGKLIDFSVSPYGKAVISFDPEPSDKGKAQCTVVYSSHPALAQKETLEKMVATIREHGWCTRQGYEEFESRCRRALADAVDPETAESLINSNAFAALSCRLGTDNSIDYLVRIGSGGIDGGEYFKEGTFMLLSVGSGHKWRTAKALDDPRTEAERLREEHPKIPFHLIINTDGWNRLVAPQIAAAQEEAARQELEDITILTNLLAELMQESDVIEEKREE